MEILSHGIHLVDTHYVRPQQAGAWLVVHKGRAAFVETNTTLAVPRLLDALDRLGLSRDAVDWVVVTHVHLDHAGGVGALLRELPQARLVVHPAGAKHLVDPSRLVAGATAVYGEERMAALFGEIAATPARRLLAPADGHELDLGGRTLRVLHTPGHAWHHIALHDPTSEGVFTGDVFGLAYRASNTPRGPFLFPTTAPTQFDPGAMLASVRRIADLAPRRLYLTHYGALDWDLRLPGELAGFVEEWTGFARDVVAAHPPGPERHTALAAQLHTSLWSHYAEALEGEGDRALFDGRMALDLDINVQGLLHWARKRSRT